MLIKRIWMNEHFIDRLGRVSKDITEKYNFLKILFQSLKQGTVILPYEVALYDIGKNNIIIGYELPVLGYPVSVYGSIRTDKENKYGEMYLATIFDSGKSKGYMGTIHIKLSKGFKVRFRRPSWALEYESSRKRYMSNPEKNIIKILLRSELESLVYG